MPIPSRVVRHRRHIPRQRADLHHRRHRRGAYDSGRQRRRGKHRGRRRRQRFDRRHHCVLDRRQRPGRDLLADRRHLRRRLHHRSPPPASSLSPIPPRSISRAPASGHNYTVTAQASDGTDIELADLHHRRHRRRAIDPGRQRRNGQLRRRRRCRGHHGRRHRVLDRRERPARDLFADRRHLRRRLHHQRDDRRRHRRRSHQDRFREHGAGPQLHRDRAGQRRHRCELADLHHCGGRRAAIDPGRCRRDHQYGHRRRGQRLDRRRHRAFHRHQRRRRHLFADRRHLRRRLHHQCDDRRRHRRRFHQDRFREHRAKPHLHRYGAGQRRHGCELADLHHQRHRRAAIDAGGQ